MSEPFEVVVTRPGTAERYVYTCRGEATVGRDPGSTIPLVNGFVSRTHLAIRPLGDGSIELRDLGSRNGTLVGGETLREAAVAVAMPATVQVGPFVLQVGPLQVETETMQEAVASAAVARCMLDRGRRQFFVDGKLALDPLSVNEFAFLGAIDEAAPAVASRTAVGDAIWGAGQWDPYMLHNLVSRLRKRLAGAGIDEEAVVTVPGVGFRFG